MIKTHHISIQKTARYCTIGELNDKTQEVWIVLHGYAQLAFEFIHNFSILDNGKRLIVAPEGLNRFYAKGFGGKPVANWMTAEDREYEIKDYLLYIQTVYTSLNIPDNCKVKLLGFSQGATTASRFYNAQLCKIDELILYAGEIAAELINPISHTLLHQNITYITGNNDPFITAEKLENILQLMQTINAKIIQFDGGHEIKTEVLQLLT
ncbi:MAG: phospholipase [Bacteroidia bacterium]|nr:phospholipase [Bacteroidia bacterium]